MKVIQENKLDFKQNFNKSNMRSTKKISKKLKDF